MGTALRSGDDDRVRDSGAILNIAKLYVGPYPFLHVYEQPVYMTVFWIFAIIGGNVLIARLVQMVYNRRIRK